MPSFSAKELIGADLEKQIINNSKYETLYNKNLVKRQFASPDNIEEDALLFIGLNPSNSNTSSILDYYSLEQNSNEHPYFKKFEDIASYCNTNWTHLDMLFIRETEQKQIGKLLNGIGLEFICEQLQLSKILIEKSNPKAIVVCNTLSRTFLGADKKNGKNIWLDFEFLFDEELGTYRWKNIPVFFSGMLTGQRALDKGSYERLRWHIKKVLQER